jgi:GNAT superfamily N-acetyltransferase
MPIRTDPLGRYRSKDQHGAPLSQAVNGHAQKMQAGSVHIQRVGPGDQELVMGCSHLFDNPAQEAATARFLADQRHHLLVAYEGETAIGFVTGVEMTHPDKGTEMFLYELYVDESHRRQGVGNTLVDGLDELARERGCYGMWVITDHNNAAARATYKGSRGVAEPDQVVFVWTFEPG